MTNKEGKGGFGPIIGIMALTFAVVILWDKLPAIKNAAEYIFNPTAGALLNWNLTWGMLVIVLILSFLITIIQKYTTDQETLKELKKEQKEIQKQMKEFKDHPEKIMELQKKQMSFMPKQMKLSMRSMIYTGIPLILIFRWFNDYFSAISAQTGEPVRFLGFMGWVVFYMIFSIIFSSILKKWMNVV
ncbi:hypothetical protein B6U91_01275 [Candidatus Pacearchaeota archaeon ex4484_71]|nr:MAG: hypothetical protein B6U91_01275 [Candidatus Pacearchaeota archaeon ex4484_71]